MQPGATGIYRPRAGLRSSIRRCCAPSWRASHDSLRRPDLITALPGKTSIESFAVRLKAEETLDIVMTVGFQFPDTGEACGIEIRRGVAAFIEHAPRNADLTLTLDKAVLDRIRLGQLTMDEAIAASSVVVTDGPQTGVERFFRYFEVPFGAPIQLFIR